MDGWFGFALALAVFFASHMIPVRPGLKGPLVALLGRAGFGVAYSLLSIALLVWVIVAAGRAPFVALWYHAEWMTHAALVLMAAACLLVAYSVAGVNPLSFGSRREGFDPEWPGIAGVSRHPVLLALGLWAGAHLLANGDLAHVVLFGIFTLFALFGMVMIDRRLRRTWGGEVWQAQAVRTSLLPFSALITGRWRPMQRPAVLPAVIGLVVWAGLLVLHPLVIGVAPVDLGF
ncbi:NnrU family protein [Pararhodobacter oceanensis]|uniref:NnrU family protein n=1 Tax=Pararhodobacter oceanensis TaxID=2172121 RepID=UPI003A8FA3C7